MESRDARFCDMAGGLKDICERLGIPLVFKTSYDKANRTSLSGKRGIGLEKAMTVFADIKSEFGLPVLTDVHEPGQCAEVGAVVDVLQIPAFLCRQTDLAGRRRKDRPRGEREKGPVSGPLGHEERARQADRVGQPQCASDRARGVFRLQHAGGGYARAADHGGDGCAG
jgi:2-dehydro-3-deoxyphosphooctonate aldolase (KDO 8-P synthase)